ncbi:MAG TPA: VWA domain-containing protein, partial [Pirellulales bacterium]|nr:VWA domain-containing protein [Pirellulales bacterium]
EADTNLRCHLVLDTSGSMDFGSRGVTKLEYARRIAGSLGYLAVEQGDAVGLTCVAGGAMRHVPPRRNPAHLSAVFDVLEQTRPKGETPLPAALHELAETAAQRALVVVLSDFFIEPDELRSCFEHLRFRKHDVAAFHLLDPLELSFEFRRPMRFLDMEGGAPVFAEPNAIAERYHAALGRYLEQVKRIVLESGVDYHRVNIEEDYERVLSRFLVQRSRKRGPR